MKTEYYKLPSDSVIVQLLNIAKCPMVKLTSHCRQWTEEVGLNCKVPT
jgi:hypothetical protein